MLKEQSVCRLTLTDVPTPQIPTQFTVVLDNGFQEVNDDVRLPLTRETELGEEWELSVDIFFYFLCMADAA